MRRTVLTLVIGVLAFAAPSSAAERTIEIHHREFAPKQLEVFIGETVRWTNGDTDVHTVTADDGSFDSGDLATGAGYSRTFAHPGKVTYHCKTHPLLMKAELVAGEIFLTGPTKSVLVGSQFVLRGRAQPGIQTVAIERRSASSDARVVARPGVAVDGTFEAALVADESAEYRAVAGSLASEPARVGVSPRLTLRVQPRAGAVRLSVVASPPQPRASVRLEAFDALYYTWRPIAQGRLDGSSRASFTLSPRRKLRLRVQLPKRDDRFEAGVSNDIVVSPVRRRSR
jgi:plastocyanin